MAVAVAIAVSRFGWSTVGLFLILGLLSGFQVSVIGEAIPSAGIADGGPVLYAHAMVIFAIFLLALPTGGTKSLPLAFWLLILGLVVGWAFVWPQTPLVASGLLHVLTGIAAWGCGAAIGRIFSLEDASNARRLAGFLLILAVFQLFCAGLQVSGTGLTVLGQDLGTERVPGRVNGAFAHPGTLGKYVILLLIPTLPLLKSALSVTRKMAFATTVILLLVLALTQGRANFLAALGAVIIWGVIAPGTNLGGRLRLLVGVVCVSLPFVGVYLDRFQVDPDGGDRPGLLAAGLLQLARNPWLGTGPNNYVNVVGSFSRETAAGFPVHNAYLLSAAELGVPLALCLLLPFAALMIRSVRHLAARSMNPYAYSIVAFIPGLLLVTYTGWGMLSGTMFLLWFFVFGFASSKIPKQSPSQLSVSLSPNARIPQMTAE